MAMYLCRQEMTEDELSAILIDTMKSHARVIPADYKERDITSIVGSFITQKRKYDLGISVPSVEEKEKLHQALSVPLDSSDTKVLFPLSYFPQRIRREVGTDGLKIALQEAAHIDNPSCMHVNCSKRQIGFMKDYAQDLSERLRSSVYLSYCLAGNPFHKRDYVSFP
jgi:hypothetical protein